jgi:hypothetical protein
MPPRCLLISPTLNFSNEAAAVSDFQACFPIGKHKYVAGGMSYDLVVYQRGSSFHAAWYCKKCLTRTETSESVGRTTAQQFAEADIRDHHLQTHHGSE